MDLPIELWNIIIEYHNYDPMMFKSCILLNQKCYKIVKKIVNDIPCTINFQLKTETKDSNFMCRICFSFECNHYGNFNMSGNGGQTVICTSYSKLTLLKSELLSSIHTQYFTEKFWLDGSVIGREILNKKYIKDCHKINLTYDKTRKCYLFSYAN